MTPRRLAGPKTYALPGCWHLVKLACYKGSLTKQFALCRCEKDNATAVAWPPLDQAWLISVKNIRGAVQKNEAP